MASQEFDSAASWKMLFLSTMIVFFSGGIYGVSGLIADNLSETWGISKEDASWPFNIGGFSAVVVGPVIGFLYNTLSPSVLVAVSVLMLTVGQVFAFFTKNLYILAATYGFLTASGYIALLLITQPIALGNFKKYRATAISLYLVGISLSNMTFPYIVQWLTDLYGIQGCLLILGGICVQSLAYAIPLKRPAIESSDEDKAARSEDELDLVVESATKKFHERANLNRFKRVLFNPAFYLILIVSTLGAYSIDTYNFVFYDYMSQKNITRSRTINMKTCQTVGEIAGLIVLSVIIDKFKPKRNQILLGFYFAIYGGLFCLLSFTSDLIVLTVFSAFFGAITFAISTAMRLVFSDYFLYQDIALMISLYESLRSVCMLSRTPIVGYFGDTVGSYDLLFQIFSGIMISIAILWCIEPFFHKFITKFRAGLK